MDLFPNLLNQLQSKEAPFETLSHQIQITIYRTRHTFWEIEMFLRSLVSLVKSKNPNSSDENGYTALMLAIILGFDSYVDRFIKEGRNLDLQCKKGETALMYACQAGNEKVVKNLIENKCNLDLQDQGGMTALIYSCIRMSDDIIPLLLDAGCNTSLQTNDGLNAMMIACDNFYTVIVSALIRHGCDLDEGGITSPLLHALRNDRYSCAKELIKAGCDIDEINSQKWREFYMNHDGNVMLTIDVRCSNNTWISFSQRIHIMVELVNEGIRIRRHPILCAMRYAEGNVWSLFPMEILEIIFDLALLKFYKTK